MNSQTSARPPQRPVPPSPRCWVSGHLHGCVSSECCLRPPRLCDVGFCPKLSEAWLQYVHIWVSLALLDVNFTLCVSMVPTDSCPAPGNVAGALLSGRLQAEVSSLRLPRGPARPHRPVTRGRPLRPYPPILCFLLPPACVLGFSQQ